MVKPTTKIEDDITIVEHDGESVSKKYADKCSHLNATIMIRGDVDTVTCCYDSYAMCYGECAWDSSFLSKIWNSFNYSQLKDAISSIPIFSLL